MSPWMRSEECSFATARRSPAPPLPHRLAFAKPVDVLHLHIVSRSSCRQRLGPIQTLLCTDSRSYGRRAFKIMASTDVTVKIIALFSIESTHVVSLTVQRFARSDGDHRDVVQKRSCSTTHASPTSVSPSYVRPQEGSHKNHTCPTRMLCQSRHSCVCHSGSDLKIKDASQTQSCRIH